MKLALLLVGLSEGFKVDYTAIFNLWNKVSQVVAKAQNISVLNMLILITMIH